MSHRLADCWRTWGERHNYFASEADAQVFYDELVYSITAQHAAPNSPQWFNTGYTIRMTLLVNHKDITSVIQKRETKKIDFSI